MSEVEAQWAQYCVALDAKAKECGLPMSPMCPPPSCIVQVYTAASIPPLIACLLQNPCEDLTFDDVCLDAIDFPDGETPELDAQIKPCQDKLDACYKEGIEILDDDCVVPLSAHIQDKIRADFADCLAEDDCATIKACIKQVSFFPGCLNP